MVNGLGVLGWGVGGIEAEAAMLGQPITMLIPEVVGFRLTGELPPGATATDLVLTVTELLRKHGVVGKFVEFYGDGRGRGPGRQPGHDRQHVPRSTARPARSSRSTTRRCATCGFTGRRERAVALVEAYAKEQGLWHDPARDAVFSETLELDLSTVVPSPRRAAPARRTGCALRRQDRSATALSDDVAEPEPDRRRGRAFPASDPIRQPGRRPRDPLREAHAHRAHAVTMATAPRSTIDHGSVVIAAITSCTNTSNPSVMIGAGAAGQEGRRAGLSRQALGQDHLAPGLQGGHGLLRAGRPACPTSTSSASTSSGTAARPASATPGPLPEEISDAVNESDLAVVAVLSGNRNFEGRINPDVKMNYLASPPLVVAYALAGSMDVDMVQRARSAPAPTGSPCTCATSGRRRRRSPQVVHEAVAAEMFTRDYADVFEGDERWRGAARSRPGTRSPGTT